MALDIYNGQILNLDLGGTTTAERIDVTAPAITGQETLANFTVSDASTNDFLRVLNITNTDNAFVPGIFTSQNSSTAPSLYLLQQVPDTVTTNAALNIDARSPSSSVLTNRPLVRFRNFTTAVFTIEANSDIKINAGSLIFPDGGKQISGGVGAVMNINSGTNSMVFRQTANAFMRGTTGGIGIEIAGTPTIDNSAILTLTSTSKGFLPPRMTTAQRDAIVSPALGLMIYNTSTNKHQGYNGSWNDLY